MRASRFAAGGVVVCCAVAGISLSTGACGSDTPETPDGAVLDGGDSGFDAPPGCDLTKDPKDSLPCVEDSVGVFVSSTGSDTNEGTKAKPVATIGKALSLVGTKPRVYVCEGTYTGSLDVTKSVGIYGGFKCDWTPNGGKSVVVAEKPTYAIKVTAPNVSLVDLDVQGKDASAPGESSVGVFAASANGLVLRRDSVTAGVGVSGTKPGDIADFSTRAPDGEGGKVNAGGGLMPNPCSNGTGTSNGGAGGPPSGSGNDGSNGDPFATYPVYPPNFSGAGGAKTFGDCGNGSTGRNGSYGPGGGAGAGASKLGALTAAGWTPQAGGAGTAGKVGQGGGGGAALDTTGGGAGGGAGGCGGIAGAGAGGGGASTALLLFNSSATLTSTKLIAKQAGDGAQGGTGQKGQQAGTGGTKANGTTACNGGDGGHGGSGGGGGGGAGGISAGILYSGTAPTIDGTSTPTAATLPSVTLGAAGASGAGGQGGPPFKTTNPTSNGGTNGTAGVAGVAQAVLPAP